MPGRMLGSSKLNFAGDFSTRSHCSLQIPVSSCLSMYLGQWAVFRGDGMAVLGRRRKGFTDMADWPLSSGDLQGFITAGTVFPGC